MIHNGWNFGNTQKWNFGNTQKRDHFWQTPKASKIPFYCWPKMMCFFFSEIHGNFPSHNRCIASHELVRGWMKLYRPSKVLWVRMEKSIYGWQVKENIILIIHQYPSSKIKNLSIKKSSIENSIHQNI